MNNTVISRIQIKRGLKNQLPHLSDGEFGYCPDTKELFIGFDQDVFKIASISQDAEFSENIKDIYDKIKNITGDLNRCDKDLIVGAVNLVSNGDFSLPLNDSELGVNVVESCNETEIFIEDVSHLGLGFKNAFTCINHYQCDSGISFNFIDSSNGTSSLGKTFTLQFWARYKNVVCGPGENDMLHLGRIKTVFEKENMLSETNDDTITSVKDNGSWEKFEYTFTIPKDPQSRSVTASVEFMFENSLGEFSIAGVQIEEGHKATTRRPSEKDTTYIINSIIDSINILDKDTTESINNINKNVEDVTDVVLKESEKLTKLTDRVNDMKYSAKNRLHNSGIFETDVFWKSYSQSFSAVAIDNRMRISRVGLDQSFITQQLANTLPPENNVTITVNYVPSSDSERMHISLRDSELGIVADVLDYEIIVGEVFNTYIGKVTIPIGMADAQYISFNSSGLDIGESIDIITDKLEDGDLSTEWYPAPEDMMKGIFVNVEERVGKNEDDIANLLKYSNASTIKLNDIKKTLGVYEPFNGIVTANSLEGIPKGTVLNNYTVNEILKDILFPYSKPIIDVVRIYSSVNSYEEIPWINHVGERQFLGKIEIFFTPGSIPLTESYVRLSDGQRYEMTLDLDLNKGIVIFAEPIELFSTETITVCFEDRNSLVKKDFSIIFDHSAYYGKIDKVIDLINQADVKTMNKEFLLDRKSWDWKFDHEFERIVVAIPSHWDIAIREIRDNNNFNYIDAFDTKNIAIVNDGTNSSTMYKLYVMNNRTIMKNAILKFVTIGGV